MYNDINPTVHIQIQIQNTYAETQVNTNTGGNRHCCSGTNGFINFGLWFFNMRRESILTMLTIPNVQCILWCRRSVSRDLKNPTTSSMVKIQLSTLCHNGRNSTLCLHGPMSTFNWLFFNILKFSEPSLPGMTSSALQPHFCLGVYYDNGDCHILSARA